MTTDDTAPVARGKAALLELRDRLAKATGPDRELDALIYVTFIKGAHPDETREQRIARAVDLGPAYTASLDSAVTLVPEGAMWSTSNNARSPYGGWACVRPDTPQGPMQEAMAATPALALCLARIEYEIAKAGKP